MLGSPLRKVIRLNLTTFDPGTLLCKILDLEPRGIVIGLVVGLPSFIVILTLVIVGVLLNQVAFQDHLKNNFNSNNF
jgi:hypothetical protein